MREPLSATAPGQNGYLLALDGLRAVSILLVVVSHLGLGRIVPGGLGVTIFFFISGFIITRNLLLESARSDSISLPGFYIKRVFRLAPALLTFVLLSVLLFAPLGRPIPPLDIVAAIFYAANYYTVFHGWGDGSVAPPLSILWSLAIEEHFYLCFPLVLILLRKRLGALLTALITLNVAVLAWRVFLATIVGLNEIPYQRIYLSTDTRIDSIVFGCVVSVYAFWLDRQSESATYMTLARALASRSALLAGAAMMLASLLYRGPEFRESWRYSLQGVAMVPLFLDLFVFKRTGHIATLLASKPMVFIGKISYSLYLHHWLALSFLLELMRNDRPWLIHLLAIPLMSGLAVASYRWIETPMRRVGHRIARHVTSTAAASAPEGVPSVR